VRDEQRRRAAGLCERPEHRGIPAADRLDGGHRGFPLERHAHQTEAATELGRSGTPLDFLGRAPGTLGALTWATRRARTWDGQNAFFKRRGMENAQVSGYSDGQEWVGCKTAHPAEALACRCR
jgi:hypothetical protein